MVFAFRHRVQVDEDVFFVKKTSCQHIDLAADVVDLAFSDQLFAIGDIGEFFRRSEVQGDRAVSDDIFQFHQGIGHDGTLGRMSAAVGGVIDLVGKRMA